MSAPSEQPAWMRLKYVVFKGHSRRTQKTPDGHPRWLVRENKVGWPLVAVFGTEAEAVKYAKVENGCLDNPVGQ